LPGNASRAKTIGILLRIWGVIPPDRVPLRDRALEILPTVTGDERVWFHWGMTALAYPFFRDVAEVVGRMLALQSDFTTAQVQERMLKTWGDRATTREAAQKLLTTLVDWVVLQATKIKGHFALATKLSTDSTALQLWLLETLLKASPSGEIEAQQLLRLPEAFPFQLKVGIAELRKHDRFDLQRQGLDMEMVALMPTKVIPTPKPTRKKPSKKAPIAAPSLFERLSEEATGSRGGDEADRIDRPQPPCRPEPEVMEPLTALAAPQDQQILNAVPIKVNGTSEAPSTGSAASPYADFTPGGPLAAPLAECLRLYQEGRDFGCISLAHSLIEAILRIVCRVKLGPRQAKAGDIRNQFAALSAIGVLPIPLKTRLEQLWLERIDYLDLAPARSIDRGRLERLREDHVGLLVDLERFYFGCIVDQGQILPDHPEYWPSEARKKPSLVGSGT
jgi:hypothetical protein